MKAIRTQEHCRIPADFSPNKWNENWRDGLLLNPSSTGIDKKYYFSWSNLGKGWGYYASYVIGAQWIDKKPLVITTKRGCDKIDFLKIFSCCFNSGIESDSFSKIYGIDFDKPKIKAPELKSILSPLIVVHFLSVVHQIVKKGLKKNYITKEENLKKVKGKIDIYRNERQNIMAKRFDRISCRYQDYSENILENRLIKKALLFSQRVLHNKTFTKSAVGLQQKLNQYLSAFANVDDKVEICEVKGLKGHTLYNDYSEAIRLAKLILRRYDYCITNIDSDDYRTPVFWIDMSLLYEHYVLGLLKRAYGDIIVYQKQGITGIPDFICNKPQIILDTKYIPRFANNKIDTDIIRQLSGYARDKQLFSTDKVIPCVVIFPNDTGEENPFIKKPITDFLRQEENDLIQFYKIAVPLPTL